MGIFIFIYNLCDATTTIFIIKMLKIPVRNSIPVRKLLEPHVLIGIVCSDWTTPFEIFKLYAALMRNSRFS